MLPVQSSIICSHENLDASSHGAADNTKPVNHSVMVCYPFAGQLSLAFLPNLYFWSSVVVEGKGKGRLLGVVLLS